MFSKKQEEDSIAQEIDIYTYLLVADRRGLGGTENEIPNEISKIAKLQAHP